MDISKLPENDKFYNYQKMLFNDKATNVPSHLVIQNSIKTLKQDYRYQDYSHPVKVLEDRKKDNTSLARKP